MLIRAFIHTMNLNIKRIVIMRLMPALKQGVCRDMEAIKSFENVMILLNVFNTMIFIYIKESGEMNMHSLFNSR